MELLLLKRKFLQSYLAFSKYLAADPERSVSPVHTFCVVACTYFLFFLYCDCVLFVILRVIKEFPMSLCQCLPQLGPDGLTDLGKETKSSSPSKVGQSFLPRGTHSTHTVLTLLNGHRTWYRAQAQ